MVHELWLARENLDGRGGDRGNQYTGGKLAKVTNVTFANYCEEIEISYRTAHRWLQRYNPEENKLLRNVNKLLQMLTYLV